MLLKLAGIVLSLINTSPSYVKSVVFLCIFAGNWAGKQVHSTSSPNIAITLSSLRLACFSPSSLHVQLTVLKNKGSGPKLKIRSYQNIP